MGWEGVDWIHPAQESDQLRALVSTVMNIRMSKKAGISWLVERLLASQEGIRSIELVN